MDEENKVQYVKCTGNCGKSLRLNSSNFYKSYSPLYKNTGLVPICKTCVQEIFHNSLKNKGSSKEALIEICRLIDQPFIEDIYNNVMGKSKGKFGKKEMGDYLRLIHMNQWIDKNIITFNDSIYNLEDEKENIKDNKKKPIFDENDIQVKKDVIELIGYDPFFDYSEHDQKFLYNELYPYLDEDTVEDTYKLSQIIQIVDNNNQIRSINLQKNHLISSGILKNDAQIKGLTAIVKSISDITDKIASANAISVKNRSDKKAGKSTLTAIMADYRKKGFEDAEQDYYDQLKAKGMKQAADISNKSIIDQLQFDENDKNNMFFTQKKMVQELQERVSDLEEENRQLYVKLGEINE